MSSGEEDDDFRVRDSSERKPRPASEREAGQDTDLVVRRLAKDDGREVVLGPILRRLEALTCSLDAVHQAGG
jgi:hypothetical protein